LTEELLSSSGVLEEFVFVVCGDFPIGSKQIADKIKEHGGVVSDKYEKRVNAILLGKDGVTAYGQPTGKKSKKYKDAKKAKRPVYDYEWLKEKIGDKKRKL
jgi:hypothetical protein